MNKLLPILTAIVMAGATTSLRANAEEQTKTINRFVTSPIYQYSSLTPTYNGNLELELKGASADVAYRNTTDSTMSFTNTDGTALYLTENGMTKSHSGNLKRISMTANNYYILIIDYTASSAWYGRAGYFALSYDNTDSSGFTKVGTLQPAMKYLSDGRISVLFKAPSADLINAKFSYYMNPVAGATTTINSYSFIACGATMPDNIIPIVNSIPTNVVDASKTKVKVSNCDNSTCSDASTFTINAGEKVDLTIDPIANGFLKFEPVEGYMNIDFLTSTIEYTATMSAIKNDVQLNFNSEYHAYGSNNWEANQLDRLNQAKALGCSTTEFDLQFTSDNVPVMTHDRLGEATAAHVYNTATQSYVTSPLDVSDITYSELQNYDYGYYYGKANRPILKFETLLDAVAESCLKFDLEIKELTLTTEQATMISDMIDERNLTQKTFITSFQSQPLLELFKVNPTLNFKVIIGSDYESRGVGYFLDRAMALKSDTNKVAVDTPQITFIKPHHISVARDMGIIFQAYTASARDLSTLYLAGLNGCATDNGKTANFIKFLSNVVFNGFTFNDDLQKYEKTIEVNYDEPITLSKALTYAKAYDNLNDNFVEVTLLSNVKNYPAAFKVGDYPLELSAKSASGDTILATLTIKVIDSTNPVITGPTEIKSGYTHPKTLANILSEFSVSDNADSTISITATNDTYSPSKTTIGDYSITLTATDKSGNSVSRIVPVTVYDDAAPVITAPGKILKNETTILTVSDLEQYINANDEIDGELPAQIKSDDFTGNGDKEGSYAVNYSSIDKSGNGTTKSVAIEVNKSITGAGYMIDNTMLVTYDNACLSEANINSYLFASGLIDNSAETYITVTTDTYTASYQTLGTYTYAVKVRTTTGTEKLVSIDVRVVNAETGTLIKPTKKLNFWQKIIKFIVDSWNWFIGLFS